MWTTAGATQCVPRQPHLQRRAALKNSFFCLGQPLGTTNRQPPPTANRHQPPTANRRQPPTIVQHCFCGVVSCACLDEAECPREGSFLLASQNLFFPLKDSPAAEAGRSPSDRHANAPVDWRATIMLSTTVMATQTRATILNKAALLLGTMPPVARHNIGAMARPSLLLLNPMHIPKAHDQWDGATELCRDPKTHCGGRSASECALQEDRWQSPQRLHAAAWCP